MSSNSHSSIPALCMTCKSPYKDQLMPRNYRAPVAWIGGFQKSLCVIVVLQILKQCWDEWKYGGLWRYVLFSKGGHQSRLRTCSRPFGMGWHLQKWLCKCCQGNHFGPGAGLMNQRWSRETCFRHYCCQFKNRADMAWQRLSAEWSAGKCQLTTFNHPKSREVTGFFMVFQYELNLRFCLLLVHWLL